MARPPPPCIWRITKNQSPIIKRPGNQEITMPRTEGTFSSDWPTRIWTLLSLSVFQRSGSLVGALVVKVLPPSRVPVMVLPWTVTLRTCLLATSVRKSL